MPARKSSTGREKTTKSKAKPRTPARRPPPDETPQPVETAPDGSAQPFKARFAWSIYDNLSGEAVRATAKLAKDAVSQFRKNLPRTVLMALISFGVGWLANVVIMALRHDGYFVPPGSTASGRGNVLRGTMFWMVASTLVGMIIGYRRKVGKAKFREELRDFPNKIKSLSQLDGPKSLSDMLWGFGGAMLVSVLLGQALGAALGVGLLVMLGSVFRPVVLGAAMRVWGWIVKKISPTGPPPRPVAINVAAFGSSLALIAGFLFAGTNIRLLLAIAAGVAAFVLSQRTVSEAGAAVFFVVATGLALAFRETAALADDGGWKECTTSIVRTADKIEGWLRCPGGINVLLFSIVGGAATVLGTLFGDGLGGSVEEEYEEEWEEEDSTGGCDGEEDISALALAMRKWRTANRNASYEETSIVGHFFNALGTDFISGGMGDRFLSQAEGVPKGMFEAYLGTGKPIAHGLIELGPWLGAPEVPGLRKGAIPTPQDVKNFFGRDSRTVTREIGSWALNAPDTFPAATEQFVQGQLDAFNAGWTEYQQAVLSGDNWKAGQIEGKLTGNIFFQALAVKGPQALQVGPGRLPFTRGAGVAPGAVTATDLELALGAYERDLVSSGRTLKIKPTNVAEDAMAAYQRELGASGRSLNIGGKRTPYNPAGSLPVEEVTTHVAMSPEAAALLAENNLYFGTTQVFRVGPRPPGPYLPKPADLKGGMGVSEVDIQAGWARQEDFGYTMNRKVPVPDPSSPYYARALERNQRVDDFRALTESLKTKGGTRTDTTGKDIPFWIEEDPNGFIIDRETGMRFGGDADTALQKQPPWMSQAQHTANLKRWTQGYVQHDGNMIGRPGWRPTKPSEIALKKLKIAQYAEEGGYLSDGRGWTHCPPKTKGKKKRTRSKRK